MRSALIILLLVSMLPEATSAAWLRSQGELWVKIGASAAVADEKFANDRIDASRIRPDGSRVRAGDRIPFDFVTGGRYEFQRYTVEFLYGITDRMQIGAAVPFLHTVFENDNDEVEPGTGVGDVTVEAAWRLARWRSSVMSAGLRWKIPSADVPRSVYAQPLGEGQHDLAAEIAFGRSLWPVGWLVGSVGHRWRFENREFGVDFGDEWTLGVEGGWHVRTGYSIKVRVDGLESGRARSTSFAVSQDLERRRLWSMSAALIIELGDSGLSVEIGGSMAVTGEELPVTREARISLMTTIGVSDTPWDSYASAR